MKLKRILAATSGTNIVMQGLYESKLSYVFLVVEKVIQLKEPRIMDVDELLESVDEEELEDELVELEEEDEELTLLTTLGFEMNIESSGREIAEMSAAVVSTGTENGSSAMSSEPGFTPKGISSPGISLIKDIEDPMSKL